MMDRQIIDKFLKGECTPDELIHINELFKHHPGELDKYLTKEEWEKYFSGESENNLADNLSEDIYANVYFATVTRTRYRRNLVLLGGAAFVLLFLFFGTRYLMFRTGNGGEEERMIVRNTSGRLERVVLPDQSIVQLTNGSELSFFPAFKNNREIILKGNATFAVVKDKRHPFTVLCGNVSTTALGTKFSVDGSKSDIRVSLFEGRVLVKNTAKKGREAILDPGQSVSYIASEQIFKFDPGTSVLAGAEPDRLLKKEAVPKSVKRHAGNLRQSGYLRFDNKNLSSVFKSLGKHYNIEINYPTEISGVNIYISVDTSQSVENILKNISAVNNLQLKKISEREYYISK